MLDAVGGEIAGRVARAVSTGSTHVVSYGLLSGQMIDYRGLPQGVEVSNLHLRGIVHNASRAAVLRLFARSFEGLRAGVIATDIDAVYPLADIGGALAWNAANSGKYCSAPTRRPPVVSRAPHGSNCGDMVEFRFNV